MGELPESDNEIGDEVDKSVDSNSDDVGDGDACKSPNPSLLTFDKLPSPSPSPIPDRLPRSGELVNGRRAGESERMAARLLRREVGIGWADKRFELGTRRLMLDCGKIGGVKVGNNWVDKGDFSNEWCACVPECGVELENGVDGNGLGVM